MWLCVDRSYAIEIVKLFTTREQGGLIMRVRIVWLLATLLLVPIRVAAGTVYDNGPPDIHEHYGAYGVNGSFWVSDTFTVSAGSPTITGISIWIWMFPGNHNPTAQLIISSQANGGGTIYFNQMAQFTESKCYADGLGFNHCEETVNWNSGPALPSGTYWVTLKNGSFPSGDAISWDSNAGAGCQSQGCPSQAQWFLGSLPSETFTILGTSGGSGGTSPKTTSLLMFGAGFVGLVGLVRRKLG
jgi:hypothetical protein